MLHLGNLRTALVAWMFARSSGGSFIVRMEDLDPLTSSREKADRQLADLAGIGIDWDGEVVFQSDRFPLYNDVIATLEARGLTYPCFCTRREIAEAASAPHGLQAELRYPGSCRNLSTIERAERHNAGRKSAVRLRASDEPVVFTDVVAGAHEGVPDDIVLRRNDGMPAYNLAVVVDDEFQGVEQVVRGDDLLTSTPSQMHLGKLLGYRPLSYAHLPLAVNGQGRRLAKRDGAVTVDQLRQLGRSGGDIVALIGASLGLCDTLDTVTADDLLRRFDPTALPGHPWVFEGLPSARAADQPG